MLKYALMASSILVAAPAFAQQQPATSANTPTSTAPAAPATDPIATDQSTTTSGIAGASAASDTSAAASESTSATGATQVAQVVDTEFPTYDKDANGTLNKVEFGSWMTALRTATDPSVKAASTEMKTWTATAFAQADTDKSKSVSKLELTGFLSKAQS